MDKPLWVQEVEQTTGLSCAKDDEDFNKWWVLSPTKIKLFYVSSTTGSQVIEGVSSPDMFALQGISQKARGDRRLSLRRQREAIKDRRKNLS